MTPQEALAQALPKALERELGDALERSGVSIHKGIQRDREPDPLLVLLAAVRWPDLAAAILADPALAARFDEEYGEDAPNEPLPHVEHVGPHEDWPR